MDAPARHLRLLTETIAAVNSTLDLEEVLGLVASKVADALGADACFVYLYDEREGELVLRATHGTRVEEMTRRPRLRVGEGITGTAAADRAPIAIAASAHLDPRFKQFPNLPEDEYQSILAVPILARDKLAGALNVRTRARREHTAAEIDLLVAIASQVAQTIEHAKLYAEAQRRVHELEALAKISEAVSESLYLEESLEAIVQTTMTAVGATGAALVLEDGAVAWPEGRAGAHAVRLPLRWKRRQIGELVCDRDTPFSDEDRQLLEAIAHHAAVALEHGRAVMRGVLAQEIHHRVKNNLQTVASLLRLQARAPHIDARKALDDSVNRILAIAAVHEVLTEHREDDVDLGELIDRLRAMLVQGLVSGKQVESELASVALAGGRATALALVFCELFGNALEHGGTMVRIQLAMRDGEVALAIADDGKGLNGDASGTGLSIVRALVQDELGGRLELKNENGLRAEVVFPRVTHEVLVFVRRGDEWLVVHRVPDQGGYWHSVAGGVEPGETAAQAAARELEEETGLAVSAVDVGAPFSYVPEDREQTSRGDGGGINVECFLAEAPPGWEPELDWEHDDYRWCALADALMLLFWPEPREVLRRIA